MTFVPLVAALALIWKIVDFAKQVRVRDTNAVVTQLATWLAGVIVIFVLANSDFGDGIRLAGETLGRMNAWSLVLVGMSIASTGSVAYDYKRAIDHNDSAAMPALVSGEVPITPPATTRTVATRKA